MSNATRNRPSPVGNFTLRRRVVRWSLLGALLLAMPVTLASAESEQALVTYSGLRVYPDGSSTLVVNLTEKTDVNVSREGKRFEFLLVGAKVRWANNKNPLRAEYFRASVLQAKLDDVKSGVRLRVTTRVEVEPQHRMEQHGSVSVLRIDFPPPG